MNDRARYRDFYDFAMINKFALSLDKIMDLVRIKEIRKNINMENIFNNWQIAKSDRQKDDLVIFFSKELKDDEIVKELKKLDFREIENNILWLKYNILTKLNLT